MNSQKKYVNCLKCGKVLGVRYKFCLGCIVLVQREYRRAWYLAHPRYIHKIPMEKKCEECKVIFFTFYSRKKYCGSERKRTGCAYKMQIKRANNYAPQWRAKNPLKLRFYREKGRVRQSIYYRKWYVKNRQRNPVYREHNKIGQLLRDAVKRGRIKRALNCQQCFKKTKVVAHHIDYDKPFEVIWLCKSCHSLLHNSLRSK